MKRDDLSRLEAAVRDANPVLKPSDLVDSEESNAVTLLVAEGRRTMTTTLTPQPPRNHPLPSATRRWAWAFAAAFTVAILVVGVVALLQRGSDSPVIDQASTTMATATTTPEQPGEMSILGTRTSGPVPPLATCPEGSRPDQPGPADQARPPASRYWTRGAIDEQSGVMVLLAETARDGSHTWTFDLCTNTWQLMHPDQEPPTDSALVYDRDSDRTIAVLTKSVWSYDVETDTWTHHRRAPSPVGDRLSYHDPSGLVVAADLEAMTVWAYDVDTDTWTAVEQSPVMPPVGQPTGQSDYTLSPVSGILGYDPLADLLVLYLGDNCFGAGLFDACGTQLAWVFDPSSGRWWQEDTVTPEVDSYLGGQAAFDGFSDRVVVFAEGALIAYDARAHEWEVLYFSDWDWIGMGPLNRHGSVMAFDPINQRLVITGGNARMQLEEPTFQDRNDVWAFDTRTGEWIVLLGQGE